MASDVPLDYAIFQLSPRRSRCELFVSYDGNMEKLASGLVKPFVTNLKVAEEQVALAVKSIKLDIESCKDAERWFTKGTIERFVQFVSTPEVLEMVNTFDVEMSQLESARRIYSQGAEDNQSTAAGRDRSGATAASDVTKKELLRAIDIRLEAVTQDLSTACSHASAAGFLPEMLPELQCFADHFGAHRLSEACSKFINLSHRRPELFTSTSTNPRWNFSSDNPLRCSAGSDMSLDGLSDDQSNPSSYHPTNSTTEDQDKANPTGSITAASSTTGSSGGTPQLTRRLSVQERISLFESKQKENSSSSVSTTPSSASAGVKPELRRLSSDINSSSDKPILRRWSGASDMSIDVSGERKEMDTNANTPTPSSASSNIPVFAHKSKDQGYLKAEEGAKDYNFKDSKLPVGVKFGGQLLVLSAAAVSGGGGGSRLEPGSSGSSSKIPSLGGTSLENVGLKDQQSSGGRVRSRVASFGRGEDFGFENQSTPGQTHFKFLAGKAEQLSSAERTASEETVKGPSGGGSKPQKGTGKSLGLWAAGFESRLEGQSVENENEGLKLHSGVPQRGTIEVLSESGAAEGNSLPLIPNEESEADPIPPQPKWRSLEAEIEKSGRKDSKSFEKRAESSLMQIENSGLLKSKFQEHGPISEQTKKVGGRREEGGSGLYVNQPNSQEKSAREDQEPFSSISISPMDQAQRVRQTKGNQGLNDGLKMKANELEKLFAEHKLRATGDQSNSARRNRPSERAEELEGGSLNWKPRVRASPSQLTIKKTEAEPTANSSNMEKFYSTPSMKMVDSQDYDVTPKHNVYSLGFSDDSRGKLYQTYMQKRDAKLREDWSLNGAEKEAKMKAMQDTLEKSRAEMKAKLPVSADKKSSARANHNQVEKLMSSNVRSASKSEQPVDSFISDEDGDRGEYLGKKLSETFLSDSSSRSAQSKQALPNKNTASSTPRNSSIPIPRSSGKASNSAVGRQRLNADNPLTQSVPNFSDLRKENTKPSSAASKLSRPQGRNHARKKSTSEDMPPNEKARRTRSLRKSTSNSMQANDICNSDDVDDTAFILPKHDMEQNDLHEKCSKDMESISFTRKGNGDRHITGLGIDRSVASIMAEAMRNGQDFDITNSGVEEMMDMTNEEEDDFGGHDMENGKGRLSPESEKSTNSGYENNDVYRFSQAGLSSVTELPSSMPPIFRTMGSVQDSAAESPGSWSSHVHYPFSFSHEIPDASDSPIGSPASWNFDALGQADAEAARIRRKWGAAQKLNISADPSHSPSRKDANKGFKRFLKFGRKNRASESLADWISATTSEGDDEMEDGRDPAYRSSEDLRKSRMGFSQSHHSDDGFSEGHIFNEQAAPKSFFSLSNFRSKGSDSKLR